MARFQVYVDDFFIVAHDLRSFTQLVYLVLMGMPLMPKKCAVVHGSVGI